MSTIVVVKKAGKVCIAADSLTSFGDLRMGATYEKVYDKIQKFGDSYFGIVGSAAHALVMESILKDEALTENEIEIDLSSRENIFESFRALHPVLKDKYFLNSKDEEDDPYEATHIDALIANEHGIFGVYSLREVSEFNRFWAIGSGSEFALGAMFAMYDRLESAEEIAKIGVEAGAEFNSATSMPMTSYTLALKS
ncbi:MAG: MFS transporter [Gammaproteobacteria bacterium]|nr:MFS transporter [Gammaproteobacteria bacterium]